MNHTPLQTALRALSAGLALMLTVVFLPIPGSSPAWRIAQKTRYEQRFPELRPAVAPPAPPATMLAEEEGPKRDFDAVADEESHEPAIRTAQRPMRTEHRERPPRAVLFLEEEPPAGVNLAPDPAHLDVPSEP